MPKIPTKTRIVRCPSCDRPQPDNGRRQACGYCGCQPLPSYAYPVGSAFHPLRANAETQSQRIARRYQDRAR